MKKIILGIPLLIATTAVTCYAHNRIQKDISVKVDQVTIQKGDQVEIVTPNTAPGFEQCALDLKPSETSKQLVLTVTRDNNGKGTLTCQHT